MRRWVERGALVALGMGLAVAASVGAQEIGADALYRKLEILAEVLSDVENHYVDKVAPTDLVYGAVRGALTALDPHSTFFSPEEYKGLLDATEGEYAGIGLEVDVRDELPEVLTIFPESPASEAGMAIGDRILVIDGRSVEGLDFDAVQNLLHGNVGTKVALLVRRQGKPEPLSYTLTRRWIRVAPIESRPLGDGLRYVWLKSFSRRVATDLEAALQKSAPKGLLLDLRGNPGGLFDEAVAVCDLFLNDGPIVAVVGRGGVLVEQQTARPHGTQPPYKVAVLIDKASASAAEIVAGALHDRGRARLFGTRSYGKGSVQSILDLSDGSGLKLTVARYLTPSGQVIDGHGIDPDESVEGGLPGSTTDPAALAAVAYLRSL